MNYKIYLLFIAVIVSIKSVAQPTTDTVLTDFYDGSTWVSYNATIINYNDACQVTESSDYYHNGNHWDTLRRNLYVYNTEEKLTELTRQRWSSSIYKPGWQNEYRNLYYYNSNGLADTMVWQDWDFSNNGYYWRNEFRQIYQYNAQGLQTYMEYNYYDESPQLWVKRDRTYNSYDSFGRPLSTLSQNWNSNTWINGYKTQTNYHSDSALAYSYSWSTTTNKWNKAYRNYYNLLGYSSKVEMSIGQQISGGILYNDYKVINQFNTDSLNINEAYQYWDYYLQVWRNSNRIKTSYYNNDVVKRSTSEYYDTTTNVWESSVRISYTNHGCAVSAELVPVKKDEKNTEAVIRNGRAYSYVFGNSLAGAKQSFKLILKTGRQSGKAVSTTAQSAITAPSSNTVNIFPNPAKNYLMVDAKDAGKAFITITNLAGKQVLQQPLKSGSQKINITSLQKGFYIVSVTTNGQVKNEKLLVE